MIGSLALGMALLSSPPHPVLPAQGLAQADGTVTVDTGLVSATKAFATISSASGTSLQIVPTLGRFPLLVRTSGVPLAELKAKIAATIGGEWQENENGAILTADSRYLREIDRAPEASRTERLTKALAEAQKMTSTLVFDEKFAESQRAESEKAMESAMKAMTSGKGFDMQSMLSSPTITGTPAHKAIVDILGKLGAETLSSAAPDHRIVFSLDPNARQVALPKGSRELLERFLAESRQYEQALRNTKSDEGDLLSVMIGKPVPPNATLGGALLELHVDDELLMATLYLYDPAGVRIASGFSLLTYPTTAPKAAAEGTPIVLDALTRETAEKFAFAGRESGSIDGMPDLEMFAAGKAAEKNAILAKPLSPEFRSRLLDPIANEPAAPLLNVALTGVTGNVVATVPDDGIATLAKAVVRPKATSEGVLGEIDNSATMRVSRDAGWTIVAPEAPRRLHYAFADRKALSTMLAKLKSGSYLDLDANAAYAVAQGNVRGASVLLAPIMTMLGEKGSPFVGGLELIREWDAYRIWGTLTAPQKAQLANGRGVAYRDLNGDATDALAHMLFEGRTAPMPDAEGATDDRDTLAGIMGSIYGPEVYANERTVRYADGIPANGYFTAKSASQPEYRLVDSASGASTFGGIEVVAMSRMTAKMPMFAAMIGTANYDRFTPAESISRTLKFVFAPKAVSLHTLSEHKVTGSKALTFAELPADHRKMIEEAEKEAGNFANEFNKGGKAQP